MQQRNNKQAAMSSTSTASSSSIGAASTETNSTSTSITILDLPDELLRQGVAREVTKITWEKSRKGNTVQVQTERVDEPSIGNYLSLVDQYSLSRVNKRFHGLFKEAASECVHSFLLAVVRGDKKTVVERVKQNPSLLLERSKSAVEDYSGNKFSNLTALQLMALRGADIEMMQAVEPYFKQLQNSQEEKTRQLEEIKPQLVAEQKSYDFCSILQAILHANPIDIQAALAKQDNGSPLCQALNQFRQDFARLSNQEINFNPQHLLKTSEIYDSDPLWQNHITWGQRDLFWRQVEGYVQRYLPACYAQAFSQGIYYIVEKTEPLQRSFNFRSGGGSFYPLTSSSSQAGLGYDFAGWGWRGATGG